MQPQSLAALLAEHPELCWLPASEPSVTVARSVHVRWRLQREYSDAEAGAGYERSEALAAQGVSANDIDSREFAQGLVAALAEHLTPRNLTHLAEAFAGAYWDATIGRTPVDTGATTLAQAPDASPSAQVG